jgi:UDPglucose 6-dehydrogenase
VIFAYDPAAIDRAKELIPEAANMHYVGDPYNAAQDADALLILTD